jgi:hypothetical protein
MTYRVNPSATDVNVQIQTSTDLVTWSVPTGVTITPVGTDPATGDPMMQAQVPVTGPTQFIRLRATPQ